jgi:DNA polymerase-3 subunit gamma/tau
LYRRWRPQRFADVVGQTEIIRTLRNAVIAGDVAHAYLFSGERGIGKTSVARILSRAINCLAPEGGEPCNRCAHCTVALDGKTLDILEIDGASNRGIDQVRRLRQEVGFAPTDLSTKVYVIDEVHMLTNEAFNALLKTLEEPPPHAVFIFATTEPHKLPRTIVSRCQAFDFRRLPAEPMIDRLRQIASAEGMEVDADGLSLIARRANGGMRDAIVLLEQAAAFHDGAITASSLNEMLGLAGEDLLLGFLDALRAGERSAALERVAELVDRGKDLEFFLADLIVSLRDQIASSAPIEPMDVALCQGMLEIKAGLGRSLDRRIHLEIGLLALMDRLAGADSAAKSPGGSDRPASPAKRSARVSPGERVSAAPKEDASEARATAPADEPAPTPEKDAEEAPVPDAEPETTPDVPDETVETSETSGWNAQWQTLLETIAAERVAVAAFLAQARPRLDDRHLLLTFSRDGAFPKECLEKPENFQYLAGAIRRSLGDEIRVELELDDGGRTGTEQLREDARWVRDVFDGTIVRED